MNDSASIAHAIQILEECAAHFCAAGIRRPTMADLRALTAEELCDVYKWACACRLTCVDRVDWALEPMPNALALRLALPRSP